jgi:hypothetical protein
LTDLPFDQWAVGRSSLTPVVEICAWRGRPVDST